MELNRIINIIQEEVNDHAMKLKEVRDSKSTSSCYIKICCGETQMLLRIADHMTSFNVWTLRSDKIANEKQLRFLITKKIKEVSHRAFKNQFFGR